MTGKGPCQPFPTPTAYILAMAFSLTWTCPGAHLIFWLQEARNQVWGLAVFLLEHVQSSKGCGWLPAVWESDYPGPLPTAHTLLGLAESSKWAGPLKGWKIFLIKR